MDTVESLFNELNKPVDPKEAASDLKAELLAMMLNADPPVTLAEFRNVLRIIEGAPALMAREALLLVRSGK